MDGEELELFAKGLADTTARASGAALDAALDDLGWLDALATDRRAAVSLLFEAQGRAGSTSSALHHVLVTALGRDADPALGVVLPGGLGLEGLGRCRSAVVAGGVVDVGDLELQPIGGIDPALGLVLVVGAATGLTEEALAAGRVALAHELVGVSRTMLRLARDHAVERIQFGRPIAAFQAVRHRLAEAYVAVEAADAAAAAAWDDGSPFGAAMAKAVAGRSARTVARHCQQVLAGIGFTTEHDFHRFARRSLVLDHLLGDARSLIAAQGKELLRSRQLPAPLPL